MTQEFVSYVESLAQGDYQLFMVNDLPQRLVLKRQKAEKAYIFYETIRDHVEDTYCNGRESRRFPEKWGTTLKF